MILSSILVVSQLVRLSRELVAFGLSADTVLLPFLYITLPFMSFNIPIAYLGAVMLTYNRLSSDGEYAAMLASGYSLARSSIGVFLLAGFLYGLAATSSVYGEPWGRRQLEKFFKEKAQGEVDNLLKFRLQPGVFNEDFLQFVLLAEQINEDRTQLTNVLLAPQPSDRRANWRLFAPIGEVQGSVSEGSLKLRLKNGLLVSQNQSSQTTLKFREMDIDLLRLFRDQILGDSDIRFDYRSYPPQELSRYIDKIKDDPTVPKDRYWKARFLFHQRFATPFVIFVFACFGLVLGVIDPRSNRNLAYLGAMGGIVFGYVVLMVFKWFAERGSLDARVAAWIPTSIMLMFGIWLVYQRHRLPPSESSVSLNNLFNRSEKETP